MIAEGKDANIYIYCSYVLFALFDALSCHMHSLFTIYEPVDRSAFVYIISTGFTFDFEFSDSSFCLFLDVGLIILQ